MELPQDVYIMAYADDIAAVIVPRNGRVIPWMEEISRFGYHVARLRR